MKDFELNIVAIKESLISQLTQFRNYILLIELWTGTSDKK